MQKGKLNTHRQAFRKYNMDSDKRLKGVTNDHTVTRWIDLFGQGSYAQNETKNALITFLHSYNQHKQNTKHNKIQLKQELWPPSYMNNGKLPHNWGKKGTKVIQVKRK